MKEFSPFFLSASRAAYSSRSPVPLIVALVSKREILKSPSSIGSMGSLSRGIFLFFC